VRTLIFKLNTQVLVLIMDKFLKREASCSKSSEKSEVSKPKCRKYDNAYLQFGFTELENKPQCVICSEVLSVESMKPSKMKRHLETKHSALKNKPVEFFQRKLLSLRSQQVNIKSHTDVSKNAIKASYEVALRIAKVGKPHTIAEELILPAAIDMVSNMINPQEADKLKKIPLSNDTVSRRISDMVKDVQNQLKMQIKESTFFSIQCDESTDITNCAQFLCFIRYDCGHSIKENVLFCKSLPDHATGESLFKVFIEATEPFEIDWNKCISICSDGARALSGKNSGLIARLKTLMPNANWVHCFLHRQALAAKGMPDDLRQVLAEAIKVVNYVKSRPLQSRLLENLCEEVGALHKHLLFHTEVRWLSRGNVLSRLFSLRSEMLLFLMDSKHELSHFFSDEKWLIKLAYLADIFSHLNILNSSLQGPETTILYAQDRVNAFVRKLTLWNTRIKNEDFENFQLTQEFKEYVSSIGDTSIDTSSLSLLISSHLEALIKQLNDYIPVKDTIGSVWITKPFSEKAVQKAELNAGLHDELIDISNDQSLKLTFDDVCPDKFWLSIKKEHPELTKVALKILIPFSTSYNCEKGFSTMVNLKTKSRNRLALENDIILCLTKINPDILQLVNSKQVQVSH
jgi:hypothetical protein